MDEGSLSLGQYVVLFKNNGLESSRAQFTNVFECCLITARSRVPCGLGRLLCVARKTNASS